jgi:putative transposase
LVDQVLIEQTISVSRACKIVHLTRSMYYYTSQRDDSEIIQKLNELAEKYPTRGFDTYYGKIRMQGLVWNRKRVLRVYRSLNLKMRRKRKRRLPTRIKKTLEIPATLNETWSVDFMSDALTNGRRFRVLNVIDDHNREALINEAYFSIPAERLVDALKRLIIDRGKPKTIRTDNGPEFISKVFAEYCTKNAIAIQYIQPGKPAQNAYIERFNRTFREDVLDAYLFGSIQEVNDKAYEWQIEYNQSHPCKGLNGLSPWLYIGDSFLKEVIKE